MIIGSGVFGYVLGNVSDIVATDSVSARVQEKLHSINAYMRSRHLPIPLQVRIRKFFRYMLKHKSVYDERGILDELSLSLRYELTEYLNKDSIKRMPILHGLDSGCISMIVENLNPVFYSSNEVLFREGEVGLEMFFMSSGQVDLTFSVLGVEHKFRRMILGDYFGELPLLPSAKQRQHNDQDSVQELEGLELDKEPDATQEAITRLYSLEHDHHLRLATGRAVTICDLYSLRHDALDPVFEAFPSFEDELEAEGQERRTCLIRVRHLVGRKAAEKRAMGKAAAVAKMTGGGGGGGGVDARVHPLTVGPALKDGDYASAMAEKGDASTHEQELKEIHAHASMNWGNLSGKARKAKKQTSPAVIQGGKKVQVMMTPHQEALRRPALHQAGIGVGGSGGGQAGSMQVHEKLTQQHEATREVLDTVVRQQKQSQSLGKAHSAHAEEMQAKMEALTAVQDKTKQELVETKHEVRAMATRVVALEGKLDTVIALLERRN
jgi:CRP-like cAMP-binding protein